MNANDPVTTAQAHWGLDLPDWVLALAKAAAAASQSKVAKTIGYSPAVVSQVLRRAYAGDMTTVETAVRGAFLEGTINCPELGPIPGQDCVAHRRRAQHFSNTNPLRVRMFRACRKCPLGGGEAI